MTGAAVTATAADHISRPRLLATVRGARSVVIAAGGGYGKSALAAEAAETTDALTVRLRVRADPEGPGALLLGLRQSLQRAGLDEAAEILGATSAQPSGLPDALHDGLLEAAVGPILLLIDDAHRLDAEAGGLLAAALVELPRPHRALLCTRWLTAELRPLVDEPDSALLVTEDLGFTDDEIVALGAAHGLALSAQDAATLRRATGGWASALRLLLPSVPAEEVTEAVERVAGEPATVGALTERLLERLASEQQEAAIALAHLPLIDSALADRVTGQAGVLEALAVRGMPLASARDGWWEIAEPVREGLAARGDLDPAIALAAAEIYDARQERREAVRVLLRAGCEGRAVELAGAWSNVAAVRLGAEPLRQLCGAVGDAALARDPRVLIHLSRACGHENDAAGRTAALDRAEALDLDAAVADEVEAERVLTEMWLGRVREVRDRAVALLDRAGVDRPTVRAKALVAVARAESWSREAADLRHADALLAEAMGLWDRLGETAFHAQAALVRGLLVAWPLGQHEQALEHVDACLAQAGAFSSQRAQALPFKAFVLTFAGRHEEAERCADQAAHLGERLRNGTVRLYASWARARIASHRGDRDATLTALDEGLRSAGDWFIDTAGGAYYLADGAQLLDRVGLSEVAWEWLEAAQRADDGELGLVPLAAFGLHARSGSPRLAETHLAKALERPSVEPRDAWRVALLRAEAARRDGDESRAVALTREALELAAATDVPDVAWVREPHLTERLVALLHAGSAAPPPPARTVVRLLGGFAVTQGGEDVTPPSGRLADLVKLVALGGGRVPAGNLMEDLWPDAAPDSARTRLRQLLARLRRHPGALVEREGSALRLPEGAEIDHAAFVSAARKALAGPPTEVEAARIALALSGDLLPEDSGEQWAAAPRREVTRLRLALLDRLAGAAAAAGDVDEAGRLTEEAIALEPLDTARHHWAADKLQAAGRGARARSLRERAAAAQRLAEPTPG